MLKLNEGQQTAVDGILKGVASGDPGFTLVGEGGTGKTTCIFSAIEQWIQEKKRILITAPTNKAVKQLEKTSREWGIDSSLVHYCTVAKALGLTLLPDKERKRTAQVKDSIIPEYDIMIMDEGSMVSGYAFHDYLMPVVRGNNVTLIVMGDDMQLPPPREQSSPALEEFKKFELNKVERFDSGSPIAKITTPLRESIKTNKPFRFDGKDYDNLEVVKPAKFVASVVAEFKKNNNLDEVRALAWTNKRVDAINNAVRLSQYGPDVARFEVGERIVTGAPIMDMMTGEPLLSTDEECIVKNVEVSSIMDDPTGKEYKTWLLTLEPIHDTEVGTVYAHVIHEDDEEELKKSLDDIKERAISEKNNRLWWRFHQLKDMFSDIRYCYCITVHRSQGSTLKTVLVDVNNILRNPRRSERNRLLYVAFSRSSDRLITCKERFVS